MDSSNLQYDPGQSKFFTSLPDGTGAPGSAGIVDAPAGVGGNGVIASPVVSVPYASSQLAESQPRLPVTAGDTSAMSSDSPVNGGPLQPGPLSGPGSYIDTGAGGGVNIANGHHPNAAGGA